jgi:hypothetical protein
MSFPPTADSAADLTAILFRPTTNGGIRATARQPTRIDAPVGYDLGRTTTVFGDPVHLGHVAAVECRVCTLPDSACVFQRRGVDPLLDSYHGDQSIPSMKLWARGRFYV